MIAYPLNVFCPKAYARCGFSDRSNRRYALPTTACQKNKERIPVVAPNYRVFPQLPKRSWTPVPARGVRYSTAIRAEVQQQTAERLGILEVDPDLIAHEHHLNYRWDQYCTTKSNIEAVEGSLTNFARGYGKFGLIVEEDAIVYREWAPGATAAQLIGDFNGWYGESAWMQRDEFGVWTIRLPHVDGKPAIPHGSRVKVKLQHAGGWWVDRIPAWIHWATVEPGVMGAQYDGIFWNPPEEEKYKWKYERPPKPKSLRIYEAHVGMSSEDPKVATYTDFKDVVLPRVKRLGYTAIQLMAVQEHAYYASFGYHVTNPFAVSSRSGTPEELKAMIDEAHRLGIYVLLDVVHSHISSNADDGLAGFDMGQAEESNYFRQGEAGYHSQWDSRILNYRNWEVLRYLLSNATWWLEEYRFDGFRFDGVTSMLYHHHGINHGFTGNYQEYFSPATDVDAVVYLMLANEVIHSVFPEAVTIAEDVSGMPTLCRPVHEGGVGFDYRLGMAIPDQWIKLLKHVTDEEWSMMDIVSSLCNRRYTEKTVAYAESHDQALVGDQTIAFRLMGAEMYENMSALQEPTPVIDRGMSLHKMIRAVTMVLGGEAWLTFMGNEFGHPEWIDFPREGNDWSHHYCRRQWSLADIDHLRYKFLQAWDEALMQLEEDTGFLSADHFIVSFIGEGEEQVIVAERGPLVFVFNFSPHISFEGYKIGVPEPGRYECILDSDEWRMGGQGRIGHGVEHFSASEGIPGQPETNFNGRAFSIMITAPPRTCAVYARMTEEPEQQQQVDSGAYTSPTYATTDFTGGSSSASDDDDISSMRNTEVGAGSNGGGYKNWRSFADQDTGTPEASGLVRAGRETAQAVEEAVTAVPAAQMQSEREEKRPEREEIRVEREEKRPVQGESSSDEEDSFFGKWRGPPEEDKDDPYYKW